MKNKLRSTSLQIVKLQKILKGVTETSRRIKIKQDLRDLRILKVSLSK